MKVKDNSRGWRERDKEKVRAEDTWKETREVKQKSEKARLVET